MGFSARKTEHTGAKHGRGAYWGTKYEAKRDSRKIRRRNWKMEIKKIKPEGDEGFQDR